MAILERRSKPLVGFLTHELHSRLNIHIANICKIITNFHTTEIPHHSTNQPSLAAKEKDGWFFTKERPEYIYLQQQT